MYKSAHGEWVLYSEAQAEIDSKQAAFEASTDSFARVLDALKSASPASIVHHLNGEGACLQMITDLRYQIDALKAQISRHVESQRLRSIDCAPTDKTVLLLRMGTTMCASGIFDGYTGYWMWPHDAMPTHWQELPEAIAKARGDL
jgi:hypothetical protein